MVAGLGPERTRSPYFPDGPLWGIDNEYKLKNLYDDFYANICENEETLISY